jgi:hypothetical protein
MFVPVVHREHEEPLSARGRDLGERLATAIREFQRQYPGTSDDDLRGALRHAGRTTGLRPRGKERQALAVIAGLVAAFLGAGLFLRDASSGPGPTAGPYLAVAIGTLAAVVGAAIAIGRRRG